MCLTFLGLCCLALSLSWLCDTFIEKELNSWNERSGVAARPSGRNKLIFSWLEKIFSFSKAELAFFVRTESHSDQKVTSKDIFLWQLILLLLALSEWFSPLQKGASFHTGSSELMEYVIFHVALWLIPGVYCSGADSWRTAPARVIVFSLAFHLSLTILQENLFSSFLFHQQDGHLSPLHGWCWRWTWNFCKINTNTHFLR